MNASFKIFARAAAAFLIVGFSIPTVLAQSQSVTTNAAAEVGSTMGAAAKTPFGSRFVRAHDPSTVVKCKDEYWVFYTGRGIPSYHSKDLVKWEPGPHVLTNAPAWAEQDVPEHRGGGFWAPDVIHLGDRYLLYYSISTFGQKTSALGLMTNPTLDPNDPAFHWADEGEVIRSTSTNDFNTIDPAVSVDADGKLWLSFGSYWSGIKLIQLDAKTGKRIAPDSPIYSLAHSDAIEASYIYHHGSYYYLFVNWGQCCKGMDSTYNIRIGRSQQITGPYLDQSGVDLLHGGGTLFLNTREAFIGPGHAGIIAEGGNNWFSCHFYDGSRGGLPTLAILPLRWSTNDWPEIALKKTVSEK